MSILSNLGMRLLGVKPAAFLDVAKLLQECSNVWLLDYDDTLVDDGTENLGHARIYTVHGEKVSSVEFVRRLRAAGQKVILCSARSSSQYPAPVRWAMTMEMIGRCQQLGIGFDGVWGARCKDGKWRLASEDVGKPAGRKYVGDEAVAADDAGITAILDSL